MRTYYSDDLRFEVPDGFRDKSLQMLTSPEPVQSRISLTIAREPRSEAPLLDQIDGLLKETQKRIPGGKLAGRRAREVGGLPAVEVRIEGQVKNLATFSRQVLVGYYGTLLTFTFSGLRGQRPRCERAAERLIETVRFRKQ